MRRSNRFREPSVSKPETQRELVYFVDHCLAKIVPATLRAEGMKLITLTEAGYPPDAKDLEWIPSIAAQRLIILTKDKEIRRDSLEVRAVEDHRAWFFSLGRGHRTAAENAAIILHHRPTIERIVRSREPPIIAQLNMGELMIRGADGTMKTVKRRGG